MKRSPSDQKRRQSLRRPRMRFERGLQVIVRACDAKRWAWQRRVWNKYGLAAWDVALLWEKQRGLCPICNAELSTKTWVIDHRHVKGYAKRTPSEKRKLVRGILDNWCNHRVLSICERAGAERVLGVVYYLKW